jgi:hypothetical protein
MAREYDPAKPNYATSANKDLKSDLEISFNFDTLKCCIRKYEWYRDFPCDFT